MTPGDRAELRKQHIQLAERFNLSRGGTVLRTLCGVCDEDWPCTVTRLLNELDAALRELGKP